MEWEDAGLLDLPMGEDARPATVAIGGSDDRRDMGFVDFFVILLITIGPLKAAIIYAKLTGKAHSTFKRQVAFKTVTVATIVCLVLVVAGHWLLGLFHVSLPALKIAGGLILLLFALDMVMGGGKKAEEGDAPPSADIAIYPLAMPLMATPQGLVAITTIVAVKGSIGEPIAMAVMVLVIMGINLAILLSADMLLKSGGGGVMVAVGKVVGLLLAALAIQLMISSFRDLGVIAAARRSTLPGRARPRPPQARPRRLLTGPTPAPMPLRPATDPHVPSPARTASFTSSPPDRRPRPIDSPSPGPS